jgi:hypothetical protein
VINSIYFVLPSLTTLKKFLPERVSRYLFHQVTSTRGLITVVFVIMSFAYFFTYVYSIKMMQLRNIVYDMLESVPVEVIE